jgi:hypothetical protein
LAPIGDDPGPFPVSISRSSGWSGLKTKFSSLENSHAQFREEVSLEISHVLAKLTDLTASIKVQGEEIKTLKAEN